MRSRAFCWRSSLGEIGNAGNGGRARCEEPEMRSMALSIYLEAAKLLTRQGRGAEAIMKAAYHHRPNGSKVASKEMSVEAEISVA